MRDFPDIKIDDRWILSRRTEKNPVDPAIPYAWLHEQEYCPASGRVEDAATVFLTNRECPYHCLMCDLWKNTTDHTLDTGNIPAQIEYALARLPAAKHLKLYNSGNFFDTKAIPEEDYEAIAGLVEPFEFLIVENHPGRLGESCLKFKEMIKPQLEVAMGLETVHPVVLQRLNKRMTLNDFENAVDFLRKHGIRSRAFILLRPPFMTEKEGVVWAKKSLDFAFSLGISSCAIIPTRAGNGAMDELMKNGMFKPPVISSLEEVTEYGIKLNNGPVFADLWDIEMFSNCDICLEDRIKRLRKMNLSQKIPTTINCSCTK